MVRHGARPHAFFALERDGSVRSLWRMTHSRKRPDSSRSPGSGARMETDQEKIERWARDALTQWFDWHVRRITFDGKPERPWTDHPIHPNCIVEISKVS